MTRRERMFPIRTADVATKIRVFFCKIQLPLRLAEVCASHLQRCPLAHMATAVASALKKTWVIGTRSPLAPAMADDFAKRVILRLPCLRQTKLLLSLARNPTTPSSIERNCRSQTREELWKDSEFFRVRFCGPATAQVRIDRFIHPSEFGANLFD